MRDALLMLFLAGSLPVALWRPFYGVCIFAWLSLMNPHRLTYGLNYSFPWAMVYALVVIFAVWFREKPLLIDSIKRYWVILLYVCWMGITTLNAADREGAEPLYMAALKVHLMVFITLMLLNTPERLRVFTIVITLSIAFFGFKGGFFTITTAGAFKVWGPPNSAIEDNNHLAAGLLTVFPLVYWLQQTARRRSARIALLVGMLMIVASVLGSNSRGAFVGIIAMTLFLIMKGKHRIRLLTGIAVAAAIALPIMPSSYWERMDSIEAYEEDASALGRINTWTTAFRVANDRFTGAGMDYYGSWLYFKHVPNPLDVHSAHSIYFQALGEQGWIGLFLYVLILWRLWVQCSKIAKRASKDDSMEADRLLARMLQVSLIGFMTAGAFVNIGNWDMYFYLAIVVYALNRRFEVELAQQADGDTAPDSTQEVRIPQGVT
jgi:putative inorganic carbon (hco3(-)) transporter